MPPPPPVPRSSPALRWKTGFPPHRDLARDRSEHSGAAPPQSWPLSDEFHMVFKHFPLRMARTRHSAAPDPGPTLPRAESASLAAVRAAQHSSGSLIQLVDSGAAIHGQRGSRGREARGPLDLQARGAPCRCLRFFLTLKAAIHEGTSTCPFNRVIQVNDCA